MAAWLYVGLVGAAALAGCSAATAPAVEVSDAAPVERQSDELLKNALTPDQSRTALRLIDNRCGDTWCDGDYDYKFRRLVCVRSAATCTLTLQVFPIEGVASAQRSYWRSCKTSGFSGFDALVASAPSGYQSLRADYYDALTECLGRIQSRLH